APIGLQAMVGLAGASGQVRLLPAQCPAPPAPAPPPAKKGATELLLSCGDRKVVLEDVFMDRGRVQLLGVADRRLAGQKVSFVFAANGKVVATARVGADGRF